MSAEMGIEPPECNWPSGHDWEGSQVQLMDDDTIRLLQTCRWCLQERLGVPTYEVTWFYPEEGS